MPIIRTPGSTGDGIATVLPSGDTAYINGVVQVDAAGNVQGENQFTYASPTGGITTNADTALAAAGAAGIRNYITAIYYKNTSATASEIVVKDGATTVLFRGHAGASMAQGERIVFPVPLKGTAATALNVALLTTGTATIVSAQGYTGA